MKWPFVKRRDYEEVVYKLEGLLCAVTGSKLSKHNYSLGVMETQANGYIQDCCEEARVEVIEECIERLRELDHTVCDGKITFVLKEFDECLKELVDNNAE